MRTNIGRFKKKTEFIKLKLLVLIQIDTLTELNLHNFDLIYILINVLFKSL